MTDNRVISIPDISGPVKAQSEQHQPIIHADRADVQLEEHRKRASMIAIGIRIALIAASVTTTAIIVQLLWQTANPTLLNPTPNSNYLGWQTVDGDMYAVRFENGLDKAGRFLDMLYDPNSKLLRKIPTIRGNWSEIILPISNVILGYVCKDKDSHGQTTGNALLPMGSTVAAGDTALSFMQMVDGIAGLCHEMPKPKPKPPEDPMVGIIIGSVFGGLAALAFIGFILYRYHKEISNTFSQCGNKISESATSCSQSFSEWRSRRAAAQQQQDLEAQIPARESACKKRLSKCCPTFFGIRERTITTEHGVISSLLNPKDQRELSYNSLNR